MFSYLKSAFLRPKKSKDSSVEDVKTQQKIRLGICAMDKKAKSKPMREILNRLPKECFEIVEYGDDLILNRPIDEWPKVEVLIAFYSSHFPTEKALEYIKLTKPFMINDLEMDAVLKDRRKVYQMLMAQGIDVPVHVFCNRDTVNEAGEVVDNNVIEEFDEYVVINGVHINKPLVEKPVDAEDHNIYIYYPMSAGGGSKRLFRKIDDRSSTFYPHENELRTEGSYIYEEFVVTQGTDVKVYTVGPDYGHAEARKSPVVDGKVIRDGAGLEVRYPVILSPAEKEIARKIVTAFKQTVCGFDILRVQGRSYCCDVNGFSFVKKSSKYYDDASQLLVEIMMKQVRPEMKFVSSTQIPLTRMKTVDGDDGSLLVPKRPKTGKVKTISTENGSSSKQLLQDGSRSTPGADGADGRSSPGPDMDFVDDSPQEELRCVLAVVRHGDRTPKQKMKVKVTEKRFLDYFHSYAKNSKKDVKVKSKVALLRFLEVTREIVADPEVGKNKELIRQLKQIKDVLERWEISGINRKLQMKPQKWVESDEESNLTAELADRTVVVSTPMLLPGSSTAVVKTYTNICSGPAATEILLVLKWGGDLTPLGRKQAEKLGKEFRTTMYPGTEGGGILRLHATYRHDLKIKASDEGRVMKTAAAFAKGLLELEGYHLAPILASLVTVEETDRQMLDREGNIEIKEEMDRCKEHLNKLQKLDQVMDEELVNTIAPGCSGAIKRAMLSLGNPKDTLQRMHSLIGGLCDQLHVLCKQEDDEEETYKMQLQLEDALLQQQSTEAGKMLELAVSNDIPLSMGPETPVFEDIATTNSLLASDSMATTAAAFAPAALPPTPPTATPTPTPTPNVTRTPTPNPIGSDSSFANKDKEKDKEASGIAFVDKPALFPLVPGEASPGTLAGSLKMATRVAENQELATFVNSSPSQSGPGTPSKGYDSLVIDTIDTRSRSASLPKGKASEAEVIGADDIDSNLLADKSKLKTSKSSSSASLSSLTTTPIPFPSTPNKDNAGCSSATKPNTRSLYLGETLHLMADRWEKLYKDFYSAKQGMYDLSKVPDVYDSIRYEILHNSHLPLTGMQELFDLATRFENTVVPQEYGTVADDKRRIGSMMCNSLLEKIKHDLIVSKSNSSGDIRYMLDSSHAPHLEINSIDRAVRSRLYFTSESHLYTLLNVLRFSAEGQPKAFCEGGLAKLDQISELSYLTQVVFRLFEDKSDRENFRVEISFSPGAIYDANNPDSCDISPYILLNKSIPCDTLIACLDSAINACECNRCDEETEVGDLAASLESTAAELGSIRGQDDLAGDERNSPGSELPRLRPNSSESAKSPGSNSAKAPTGSPYALSRASSHRKVSGITVVKDDNWT